MSIYKPFEEFKNRFVMAPMTRGRCTPNDKGLPNEIMKTYYTERSSAGLIITEGVHISKKACGWLNVPGIYNSEQIEAWKTITDSVHSKECKIYLQLWHQGRTTHSAFGNGTPFAPSAIAANGETHTPTGKINYETPKEMSLSEIEETKNDFVQAAKNAMLAGFDGVEIHGANGYLLDQFTRSCSNKRTDEYGGTTDNRIRFPLEVTESICKAIGSEKVGYRMSPLGKFNDMSDENPYETFGKLAKGLNDLKIRYIHIMEPPKNHPFAGHEGNSTGIIRSIFNNIIIMNGGLDSISGQKLIDDNIADLIAIGVPFLANSDLIYRYKNDLPLNTPDYSTLYSNEEKGYNDYPVLLKQY